jgi:dCMP deaminase
MARLTREQYLLGRLQLLEQRSSCERGQVGALIVRKNRVIAEGYNGSPPGMAHCLDVGCEVDDHVCTCGICESEAFSDRCKFAEGCTRAIHAESNAIAWAASFGIATHGAAMWCTYSPCRSCAQLIVAAGITQFVYVKEYRAGRLDILDDAGLEIILMGNQHWDPGPDYQFTNQVH